MNPVGEFYMFDVITRYQPTQIVSKVESGVITNFPIVNSLRRNGNNIFKLA